MTTVEKVADHIQQTIEAANQSFETETSTGYEALDTHVHKLNSQAREALQARLSNHLWPIVEKLENDSPLAAAEQEMLQMLLVGDAKYYVKTENQVEIWKEEVKRIIEEMKRLQAGGLNELDSLMRLQALCHEARRIVPDLAFYYEEKERALRFDEAMRGAIDRDTRRTLANLIKEILTSDKM